MAHGDAREGKWRGKIRMEWVASSLPLYVGTRSIQLLSADPHSSAASSRLKWHPRRFKWTRPFRWKTKSGFCACAITFRTCYNAGYTMFWGRVQDWLPTPLACFPFTSSTVRHRVPSGFNCALSPLCTLNKMFFVKIIYNSYAVPRILSTAQTEQKTLYGI